MGTRVLKPQPFNPDFNVVAYTWTPSCSFLPFTLLMVCEMTFMIEESYEVSDKCNNIQSSLQWYPSKVKRHL